MSQIRSTQIFDQAKNSSLDAILTALTIGEGVNSLTFPDGTILRWGAIGSFASIGANTIATETFAFPTAFPVQCDFFHALLTPATSTDFYGITSLVNKAKNQVQFTVKNGATAQAITSGVWIAVGR